MTRARRRLRAPLFGVARTAVPCKHDMTRIKPSARRTSSVSTCPPRPPPHICPPVQVQTSSLNFLLSHSSNYTCHYAVPFHAVVEFYSRAYYPRTECTIHEPKGLAPVTGHADTRIARIRRPDRCTSDVPDGLRRRSGRPCQLYGNFSFASPLRLFIDIRRRAIADGLMTPPTTPERVRGQRGSVGYAIHPVVSRQALRFSIAQPFTSIRFAAPYSERNTYEAFTTPPTSVVHISVLGVFHFEVHARQRGGVLTVRDVLEGILSEMAHTATEHESRCFAQEVQQSVAMSRTPRRFKYLGPRVVFSGIEITHASAGAIHCDLHLSTH